MLMEFMMGNSVHDSLLEGDSEGVLEAQNSWSLGRDEFNLMLFLFSSPLFDVLDLIEYKNHIYNFMNKK